MLSALRQHGARRHHDMHTTPTRLFGPQVRPVRVQTAGSRLRSPSVKVCCYIQEGTAEGKTTAASARAGNVTRAPSSSSAAAAAAASRPPASWRRPYSPGPLTEAEFEQYWDQGYVIKRGLLTQDDINPCLQAIDRWDDRTPPPPPPPPRPAPHTQLPNRHAPRSIDEDIFPQKSVVLSIPLMHSA